MHTIPDPERIDTKLGGDNDFDTPTLPGFEPSIGVREDQLAYDHPGWVYVVPHRNAGYAQIYRNATSRVVRVDAGPRQGYDTEVRVEVPDAGQSRQIVLRAISLAYYLRATGVVRDRKTS